MRSPGFWPWRGLAQLTALWSVTLMAIAMLAVVRAHALSRFLAVSIAQCVFIESSGHQQSCSWSHMSFSWLWQNLKRHLHRQRVDPVLVASRRARSDVLIFYLLLLLGGLAYDRRMSYERWLSIHRLTGLIFLGGAAHAAMEPGTIADFEPLRTWIVILMLAGGAAWLYRVVLFNRLGPRYRYRLETIVSTRQSISSILSCAQSTGV